MLHITMAKNISRLLLVIISFSTYLHASGYKQQKEKLLFAIRQNNVPKVETLTRNTATRYAWIEAVKVGNPKILHILNKAQCPCFKSRQNRRKLLQRAIKTDKESIIKIAFILGLFTTEDVDHTMYTRRDKNGRLITPNNKILTLLDQIGKNKLQEISESEQNICSICLDVLPEEPGESIPLRCHPKHRLHVPCFNAFIDNHEEQTVNRYFDIKPPLSCPLCKKNIA